MNEALTMADFLARAARDPLALLHGPERRGFAPTTSPIPDCDAPGRRWQDCVIEQLVPHGASVLDLGCGDGDLLARLMVRKAVRGVGVELDAHAVTRCVERGVSVVQADLDGGIQGFGADSFDLAILEETMQTLRHPLDVLSGMLRVAQRGIVSFPNFGHWRVRAELALNGRMPETRGLPHRWYDTPNIHLFTLRDMLEWTENTGVSITSGFAFGDHGVQMLRDDDNLFAEEVLLVLSKKHGADR
jgi:methionine biosynthesis protein MetW